MEGLERGAKSYQTELGKARNEITVLRSGKDPWKIKKYVTPKIWQGLLSRLRDFANIWKH